MKKIMVALLMAALVAGSAFAEITFSAWTRGEFAPIIVTIPDEGDTQKTVSTGPKWDGSTAPRVGFAAEGASTNFGFLIEVAANAELGIGIHDNAKVWAKPIDWLKLTVGTFNEDDLRGKIGDFGFTGFGYPQGEDHIFQRFHQDDVGAHIALTPIEGLYVGASINAAPGRDAGNAYQYGQYGLGYQVGDLAHIRAQWVGNAGKDLGYFNAAVGITAIEGLTVDLGVKVPQDKDAIAKAPDDLGVGNFAAALGVKYGADAFGLTFRFDGVFKDDDATVLDFGLYPTYNLGAITAGLAASFHSLKDKNALNLLLTFDKPLDVGNFIIGVGANIGLGEASSDKAITIGLPIQFTFEL